MGKISFYDASAVTSRGWHTSFLTAFLYSTRCFPPQTYGRYDATNHPSAFRSNPPSNGTDSDTEEPPALEAPVEFQKLTEIICGPCKNIGCGMLRIACGVFLFFLLLRDILQFLNALRIPNAYNSGLLVDALNHMLYYNRCIE